MDVWDRDLIQHRIKIIRVGILATFVVLGSFLVYRLLPGGASIPTHIFIPLWSLAAVVGLVALLAPWESLFGSWKGRAVLYVWSVADIALITALIGWVPHEDPIFFLCYVLTTIFFGLLYQRRAQVLLLLFTVGCYSSLFFLGETSETLAGFALRIGLLASISVLSGFSSRELMSGVIEAKRHQSEAEQQRALHESLTKAQSDLGHGVSVIDLDTRAITYANDAFCRIYGYEREELISMSYMDLLAPEQREEAEGLKRTREAETTSAEYARDFVGLRKDGSRVLVHAVSKPLDQHRVVSVIRDVTEERKVEEELRNSEEIFRAVSELSGDFVYSLNVDPDGMQTWEWVTDGFTSVTGFEVTDPQVGGGPYALIHPDDRVEATEMFRGLLSRAGRLRHEMRIVTKQGDERWIEFSAEAVYDEAKGRVTRIFGTAQDVTERKGAERSARERTELLEAISELTSDYVYAVEIALDGRLSWLWVTDGFTKVTGYTPDEIEKAGWQVLIHPDDLELVNEAIEELLHSGQPSAVFEHRVITKSGKTRHVRTHARSSSQEVRVGDMVRIHGSVQDVTDRRFAELALRASERRYRTLFDRLPLGLFVRQLDGTGIDANPACVAMFGHPDRQSWVTTPAEKFYVDPTVRDAFVESVITQEEAVLETEMRRFDGSTFWGLIHARVVRDERGEPIFYEGAISDVTDKREAERKLRRSVSLLRSTIESTWDAVLVVSLDGRVETFNSRFVEMWGLEGKVLEGAADDDLLAAVLDRLKDPEGFMSRVRELYSQPEQESFDFVEFEDGRVIERYSRPQRQEDRIVGRVWSFRDVTERKQYAQRLESSLSLLETTLESVAEGILVLDESGEIVASNRRFAEMWQIPEDVVAGAGRETVIQMSAERVRDSDAFLSAIDRIRRHGPTDGVELIELTDGRVLERSTRQATRAGVGRVISFRDITQRRALEEQLRQAQKMEAVGRLAGGVAHDFNNLLTAILGYCELLLTSPDLSEETRADIREIDSAAQIGADITAQLLDLSRRRVLRPEVLDVNEVVASMEPMLQRLIGSHVVLGVEMTEEASRAEVDRSQIEQVLLNLVVNARDALPEGGNVSIRTQLVDLTPEDAAKGLRLAPGPHVMLSVTDDGAGMSSETQDRIFEPFFTTRHGEGSTGLGLSTVYGIVSQYNGHIAVDSELGRGTTFRVYIPAAADEAVPLARHRAAQRWSAGTETILLVEDDEAIRRLAKRTLERHGYRVMDAPNAAEALEIAEQEHRDIRLLLTDVVMPGMGGRDLGVRVSEMCPGIRILYMSGFAGEAVARFGDLGWNEDFFAKPFRPDSLASKVREILNREKPHTATR